MLGRGRFVWGSKSAWRAWIAKSERSAERMDKKWGESANRLGTVAEDIVAPSAPTVARERFGIQAFELFALGVRTPGAAPFAAPKAP
jgi:hypothetical protein